MQSQADRDDVSLDEVKERFRGMTPLRTIVPAEDVAAAVVFLASPAGERITGEDMNLTAGLHMY